MYIKNIKNYGIMCVAQKEREMKTMSNKTELGILKKHIAVDVKKNNQTMLSKHLDKYITIKSKQEKIYF